MNRHIWVVPGFIIGIVTGFILGSYASYEGTTDYVIKMCHEQQAVDLRGKWYDCVRMLEDER